MINVFSACDGISCGQKALENLGIKINKYYASEIDKHAIKITQKNYPNTIQLGDIREIDTSKLDRIDLLLGGTPCQDLSIAGSRKGLNGSRSCLFFEYVRLLKELKPKYFLFENVASMKSTDKDIISEYLGVEPILINSALVSAQNRKRLYWTNIPNVTQPEDKGILLKDILESGLASQNKSYALTETYYKDAFSDMVKKHTRTMIAEPVILQLAHGSNKGGIKKDKAPTSPIRLGHLQGLSNAQANRVYSIEGKSVCLNANGGGGGAKTGLYKIDLPDGTYYIRKLTPIECERLQTLPDNYTEGVSDSQRYKMLGNGWTVDVITHILKGILNDKQF